VIDPPWFDQGGGQVYFMADLFVPEGLLERIINPGTETVYQIVPGRQISDIN
jgi:hypothetical protein